MRRLMLAAIAAASLAGPARSQTSDPTADGKAARGEWDAWIESLSSEKKAGAQFWAAQRSLKTPGGCLGDAGKDLGDYTLGCEEAKKRLTVIDARRRSEQEFRTGFNSGPDKPALPVGQMAPVAAPATPDPESVPVAEAQTPAPPPSPPRAPSAPPKPCSDDWRGCKDNADFANNFSGYYKVQADCKIAAEDQAKYGTPVWPGFFSGGPFTHFRNGDDIANGIAVAIEPDVQFQNGFGAMVHSTSVCTYDMKTEKVLNIDMAAH